MSMRRRLLPAILAFVSLSSGALAAYDPGAVAPAAAPVPAAPPAAPVLSPRRLPAALADAIAEVRLRAQLDGLLAPYEHSCLVVSRNGRRLYEARTDRSLIPASNLKVLTGLAALTKLGPDTRLTTEVRRTGDDLWLVGGGDPLLATTVYAAALRNQPQVYTPIETLADAVKAAGITTVGTIRGDESRFDRQRYIPTWKPRYISDNEVGPESALTVNDGYAQLQPRLVAASAPATHAAGMLATLLQARGIQVTAGVGEGTVPRGAAVVAKVDSPPMREIVGQMLRESDNLTAELLVKELGHRGADDGSTAAGLRILKEAVATAGLPAGELTVTDGSGLDRGTRATCRLVMGAIEQDGPTGPIAAGLPVAAKDGTLSRRFTGHPAAGRLRAKTGSLDDVVGLSGWMDAKLEAPGPPTAFAFLANGFGREAVGRALQENLAAVLAKYPDAPLPNELAP